MTGSLGLPTASLGGWIEHLDSAQSMLSCWRENISYDTCQCLWPWGEIQQFSHMWGCCRINKWIPFTYLKYGCPSDFFFFSVLRARNLHMDLSLISLPTVLCSIRSGILFLCLPALHCIFPLSSLVQKLFTSAPRSSSGGIPLYVGLGSVWLWEKVNWGSSPTSILDL